MVNVLASSVVDHEFAPRSGQTKDYIICIYCFSAKYTALRRKSKKHPRVFFLNCFKTFTKSAFLLLKILVDVYDLQIKRLHHTF
jgi:hypothetical protein